jgi:flagellar basal body-associated protein FliL
MYCGAPLNETDLFCSNCGAKIAQAETPEPSVPAEPVPEVPAAEEPAPAAPETPEVPYAQPVFHTESAPADAHEPAAAAQPSYQQPAQPYPQNTYPQNAYPQNGYPQNGYPQNGYAQPYPAQQPPKKKHTGLIIGLIIGAVVFIGIIVAVIFLFLGLVRSGSGNTDATLSPDNGGGNSGSVTAYAQPEDVAGAYFEAMEGIMTGTGSAGDLLDLSYEVKYIKPEYKSEIESTITESFGELSLGSISSLIGDDFSVTYRIDDVITIYAEDWKDTIDEYELDEYCDTSAIEEMCRVEAVMAMQGSFFNETLDDGEDYEMVCVRAEGRWYLLFSSIE